MKTEKDKMLAGELYNPLDSELIAARIASRELCQKLNHTAPSDESGRRVILTKLFGTETDISIEPPFYCDYGWNIRVGTKVFFNFNCVVIDVMPVRIGDNVLIGPSVQIYTAMHPLDAPQRLSGLEYGKSVAIGSNVWIGGGAILCPGVSIGDRAVIGAGSVVSRDVPNDVVVAGNPAKVIRRLLN